EKIRKSLFELAGVERRRPVTLATRWTPSRGNLLAGSVYPKSQACSLNEPRPRITHDTVLRLHESRIKSRTVLVRGGFPSPFRSGQPVRSGFPSPFVAASPPRCEARLCLAVKSGKQWGLCPGFGLWPNVWAKPERGAQPPYVSLRRTARHSLASHRGGEAATNCDRVGEAATNWDRRGEAYELGRVGEAATNWDRGGEAATNCDRVGEAATNWDRRGEAATNCDRVG